MSKVLEQIQNVTVIPKANIYFDGKVVSHSILFPNGNKKSLGLIYPGSFYFRTHGPEKMEIVAGICRVKIDGHNDQKEYHVGQSFEVPENSGFDIEVKQGVCEYLCSFH